MPRSVSRAAFGVVADRTPELADVTAQRDVQTGSAPLAGLVDALIDGHVIGVAVGMVVVQRQQSPHEALATLVRIAHRTDRSVVDVARRLVSDHPHAGRGLHGLHGMRNAVWAERTEDWDFDPAA
jgi:hypothetical protein